MNDTAAEPMRLPERADVKGIARFLDGVGVKKACECCPAVDEWHVEAGLNMHASIPLESGKSLPVILMICKGCGNVRRFSSVRILQWLRDNPG